MTDKGKILTFPDAAAIEAEAAAWVARFDVGDVSARDQADFQQWLNSSALHRDAIAEYGKLWADFDALRLLIAANGAGQQAAAHFDGPGNLKEVIARFALCAAVVAVVLGGALFSRPQSPQLVKAEIHAPPKLSYETAVGGHRRIALSDGSAVILNTNSRLDVDFSSNRRDVHLVRGEAYFEVVHDQERPFTVYARNYVIRDVGTAFDVHVSKTGTVEVGVTKGRVEVRSADAKSLPGAATKSLGPLTAGHDILLGQKVEQVAIVSSVDMSRKLAWRQGELIYAGQPLSEVLADVSRYSDIQFEVADPKLESLPVGGAFRTDQIDAIFAALQNNFGIHAEWVDSQHVRLSVAR